MLDLMIIAVSLTQGLIALAIIAAIYVLYVIANWRIFKKAGEAGWKSIIPLYNTYTVYKFTWTGTMGLVFIVLLIVNAFIPSSDGMMEYVSAVVGLAAGIINIVDSYKLSKSFGHGLGFTIGIVFLPVIFTFILGYGSSEYEGIQ